MKKVVLPLLIFCYITLVMPVFSLSDVILLGNAKEHRTKKQYNESIECLNKVLESSPNNEIKLEALFLITKNYNDIKDWNNAIKYSNEIIDIEKKKDYSQKILDIFILKMIILSRKLNDVYTQNKTIDDKTINEIANTVNSLSNYRSTHDIILADGKRGMLSTTDMLTGYSMFVFKSNEIQPILKFRLINMILPYLDMRENPNTPSAYYYRFTHNNEAKNVKDAPMPFFRVYCILLRKIIETDDSEFIKAGTTKENALKVIKTKTSVLKTSYDKDLFEALNYYYTGNSEQANQIIKLIKQNYNEKYKSKDSYNTELSLTDYVFDSVQFYVNEYCSTNKTKSKRLRFMKKSRRDWTHTTILL